MHPTSPLHLCTSVPLLCTSPTRLSSPLLSSPSLLTPPPLLPSPAPLHFHQVLRNALQTPETPLDQIAGAVVRGTAGGAAHVSRKIVIAGTFTVDVVEAPLRQAARLLGASVDVAFAGFGQVMQSLLDPSSEFYKNADGVNVLLVWPKDLTPISPFSHLSPSFPPFPF